MSGRGLEQDGGPSSFLEIKISMGNSLDLTLPLNPEDLISEAGMQPPGLRMSFAPRAGGKFTRQQLAEIADNVGKVILFQKKFGKLLGGSLQRSKGRVAFERMESFDYPPTPLGPPEEEEERQVQSFNDSSFLAEDAGGKRVSGYEGEIMNVDISPSPDILPEGEIPVFVSRLREEMIKTLGLDAE